MSEDKIYRGFIVEHDVGEATDVLFLTGMSEPLAEAIEDDIDSYGRYLTVRYFIADAERTIEKLDESLVRQIIGAGEAEFHSHYSEITGYLWTDENVKVGGHDLLDELTGHVGKFLHMEITYSKDAPDE